MGSLKNLRNSPRGKRERGASLVELALMLPLLLLLLFGIIDFGWVLSQNLDVRHGAREGARLAAVNFPEGPAPHSGVTRTQGNTDLLVAEVCDRMETPTNVKVEILSSGSVGDSATVRVTAPAATLSGFLDWALPPALLLNSDVEIRMEQDATWVDTIPGGQACPP